MSYSGSTTDLWSECLARMERELPPEEVNTWLRPLRLVNGNGGSYHLIAPNAFVRDRVRKDYLSEIRVLVAHHTGLESPALEVELDQSHANRDRDKQSPSAGMAIATGLDGNYTFDNFVQGKSNELAYAASRQVAQKPGAVYNPLTLYGSTGLGKTHLLHAAGNLIREQNPGERVLYLTSEQFVNGMIRALRSGTIDEFKKLYRTVRTLLIDDIQFFAGKDRSQEEFFHTFNTLLDSHQQIILTCDRYPKEVTGLEPRLQSRCGWGLTVSIEPPDFETRVAILMQKACERGWELDQAVAELLGRNMRSSVRDLEGALNTLLANARFTGRHIDEAFARETLRDLLAVHSRLVTIENIQKTVADYYKLRVNDLLSRRRTQSIARPRQLAMALAKELTKRSLPEIGEAFGGRDHTTVLHACRRIENLCDTDSNLREDKARLIRLLTA